MKLCSRLWLIAAVVVAFPTAVPGQPIQWLRLDGDKSDGVSVAALGTGNSLAQSFRFYLDAHNPGHPFPYTSVGASGPQVTPLLQWNTGGRGATLEIYFEPGTIDSNSIFMFGNFGKLPGEEPVYLFRGFDQGGNYVDLSQWRTLGEWVQDGDGGIHGGGISITYNASFSGSTWNLVNHYNDAYPDDSRDIFFADVPPNLAMLQITRVTDDFDGIVVAFGHQIPEPSTVLLSCSGLVLVGTVLGRRRKKTPSDEPVWRRENRGKRTGP